MGWLQRLRTALNETSALAEHNTAEGSTGERTTGRPTSSNGASSMHLNWEALPAGAQAVSVDLTIVTPPTTTDLYFWALQASFCSGTTSHGGAHLGLQHISGYPNHCAVNWGGYKNRGGELAGTESALSSSRNNVNTRDYHWEAGRAYRLEIAKAGDGGWRGSVIDVAANERTVVRELACAGSELAHVVMWSEVFAPCDAPSVTVRWSNPTAHIGAMNGELWSPDEMRISYQTVDNGGCSNTASTRDSDGSGALLQVTNTARPNQHGATI